MIKNVHVNELLFSDLLVREPVDEVNNRITTDTSERKIILTGGRGSGKSVVLAKRELDGLNSRNPAVLTRFDAAGMFGTKEDEYFNRKVMEHYYEVVMAKKFLNHIKEYYPELFYRSFATLDETTTEKIVEIDRYINNAYYQETSLKQLLFSGEMVSEIVSLFRRSVGADTITLMIDRFDWTHSSDPRVQKILKNYFDMFERVLITSDDPTIMSDKKLDSLGDKGFEVVDYGYSKDIDVVRKIVEARFSLEDEIPRDKKFPIFDISDEDYKRMIERCDGNISTMLDALREAETLYHWSFGDFNMSKAIDSGCTDKLRTVKQLRKMSKPQKLYL